MIQEERYCPDILIQLSAVRSAVKNLEIEIGTVPDNSLFTRLNQSF